MTRVILFLILVQIVISADYLPKDRFVMLPNHIKQTDSSIENLSTSPNAGGNLLATTAGNSTCMGTYFTSQTSYSIKIGDYLCKAYNENKYSSCAIVIHMWIYILGDIMGSISTDVSDSGTKLTSARTDGAKFYDYNAATSDSYSISAEKNQWIRFYWNLFYDADFSAYINLMLKQTGTNSIYDYKAWNIPASGTVHFGRFGSDSGFEGFIYIIEIFREILGDDGVSSIIDDSSTEFPFNSWSCVGGCSFCPYFNKKCLPTSSYCKEDCDGSISPTTCTCFDRNAQASNNICSCITEAIITSPITLCKWTCSNKCSSCNSSKCAGCVDANAVLDSNGDCSCKDGYYENSSSKCIKCMDHCDRCTGAGQCTYCTFGYYYTGSSCDKCGCDSNFYLACNSLLKCYECDTLVVQFGNSCIKTSVGLELSFESPYIVIDFAYLLSKLAGIISIKASSSQGIPITTTGWALDSCTISQCKIFTDNLSVSQFPIDIDINFKAN